LAAKVREIWKDWSDESGVLFFEASAAYAAEDTATTLRKVYLAIDRLPPFAPDEAEELADVAQHLILLALKAARPTTPVDHDRLLPALPHLRRAFALVALAQNDQESGRFERALERLRMAIRLEPDERPDLEQV